MALLHTRVPTRPIPSCIIRGITNNAVEMLRPIFIRKQREIIRLYDIWSTPLEYSLKI